jgi:pimeloyl-ACP methyl ester carboxylesterase
MAAYLNHLPESARQLDETRQLNGLAIEVLSAGTALPDASKEHRHDAALSTRGEHRIIAGAGHWIQLDEPDAVVEAIRRVFNSTDEL